MIYDLKNLKIFRYSYFFLLLFFLFSGFSISLSQLALGIATLIFIFGFFKYYNKISYLTSGIERYVIIFIIVSIVLAFLSPSIIKNLDYIRDFWLFFAFVLTYSLLNSKEDIIRILYLMLIIALIQSIIVFLQNYYFHLNLANAIIYGITHYKARNYRGGFLGMHLVFSCYLLFIAVPLIYLSLVKENNLKYKIMWIIRTSALLSILALLITKTRSILVALPFALVPLLFLKKKSYFLFVIPIVLIILSIFSFTGPSNNVKENLSINIYNSISAEGRIKIWKTVIKIWQKHPIIGTGGGNFLKEFEKIIKENPEYDIGMITHAHNDYLNQLARKGIIGFIAFIYMLYGIFKYMAVNLKYIKDKLLKHLYLGLFGAYCAFLIASIFQCFYTDEENLVMLWFSIGLLAAIVKIEKGNESREMK